MNCRRLLESRRDREQQLSDGAGSGDVDEYDDDDRYINRSDHKYVDDEDAEGNDDCDYGDGCLLYTSPSPRDGLLSRMPSSA